MSVLAKIRAELLSTLEAPNKRQKRAIINLFDAIDSDLDVGYTMSSQTEEALDEYNNALVDGEMEEELVEEVVEPLLEQVEVKERNVEPDEMG